MSATHPVVLTIMSHPNTVSDVVIADMGFSVPAAAAAAIVFAETEHERLQDAGNSDVLRSLASDEAFGAQQSTIVIDDGNPIPGAFVDARLAKLLRFEEDTIVVAGAEVVTAGADVVVATGP